MRVGSIDIGTNTTRLLVADVTDPDKGRVNWLDRRIIVTRLGQGVDATGRLHPDSIARTVAVLTDYGEALREWSVATVAAVSTSAARDADNVDELLDAAEEAIGVRPDVISGGLEADLSFRGATAALTGPRPYLVIDLGGGSTEFVLGDDRPDYSVSIKAGSARLTERALPGAPPPSGAVEAARAVARTLFDEVLLPREPATLVGVGGTITSLAAITMGLSEYDPSLVDGSILTLDDVTGTVERLAGMKTREIAAVPALDPARAPVLLGGAIVLEQGLARLGADALLVSEADVLDGLAAAQAAAWPGSWRPA